MRAQPSWLLAVALTLSCTQGREEALPDARSSAPAPAARAPEVQPPAARTPEVQIPAARAPEARSPEPVGRGASGPPGIEAPRLPGAATAGPIRAPVIEGCLALAAGDKSGGSRFPVKAPTRSDAPAVSLKTSPGRLEVSHHLRHACCLKGQVAVSHGGMDVTIVETLMGSPCRCMCASIIRTPVLLPPGEYQVTVQTDELGRKTRAFHGIARIP